MSHTAWTAAANRRTNPSSSFTSDLLSSKPPAAPKKVKGHDSPREPPSVKSKEIRRLESLIHTVKTGIYHPSVVVEGCFCRSRRHPLSKYVPACMNCGLVFCSLQHPALPCPSCRSSLLSQSSTRTALSARLKGELESVQQHETQVKEQERLDKLQREIEAAGGGSFPILHQSAPSSQPSRNEPRKVLSLNTKTKKAVISTFSRAPTPAASADAPRTEGDEDVDDVVSRSERKTRVPPPKVIPDHEERNNTARRWEPLKGGGAMYVQPPRIVQDGDTSAGTGSRRKKGKGGKKASEALGGELIV